MTTSGRSITSAIATNCRSPSTCRASRPRGGALGGDRRAQAEHDHLAADDDQGDPRRRAVDGDERDQSPGDQQLVGGGVKERPEAGADVPAAGESAVEPVRRRDDHEHDRRCRIGVVQNERHHHRRGDDSAARAGQDQGAGASRPLALLSALQPPQRAIVPAGRPHNRASATARAAVASAALTALSAAVIASASVTAEAPA